MLRALSIAAVALALTTVAAAQGIGPGAVVPAVANLPGLQGTFWRSDVVVTNPGETAVSVHFVLYPEIRDGSPQFEPIASDAVTVPGSGQVTMTNVVETLFDQPNKKGALSVISDDGSPIVIGSRTYTYNDEGGSYGQEVFGVLARNTAWAAGVRNDGFYRTNVGIFLPVDPPEGSSISFDITIKDESGDEVASSTVYFPAAGLIQRSLGDLGAGTLNAGSVEVVCSDPSYFFYGYISRVDQISNDAVYRPLRSMAF